MNPKNPYENRWRWWYPAIADWMLRNPGGKLADCSKEIGRSVTTISLIANTDMFKDYLANRRKEWQQCHDFALQAKVTKVAESALDILAEVLEKKRDTLPIGRLSEISFSALDRLGYSPNKQAPAIGAVNIQQNGNGSAVVMPVSVDALREAQQAIRTVEARRQAQLSSPVRDMENEPPLLDAVVESALQLGSDESDLEPAAEFPRTLSSD